MSTLRAQLAAVEAAQNLTPRDQYTRKAHSTLIALLESLIDVVEGVPTTSTPGVDPEPVNKAKFGGWGKRG